MVEKKKSTSELIGQDRHDALINSVALGTYKELSDDKLIEMYKEAKEAQDLFRMLQLTVKLLCNSVYGGFGTNSLRYFNQAVASDITAEGRNVCQLVDKMANRYFASKWAEDIEWFNELKREFPDIIPEHVTKPNALTEDMVIYCDTDSNYLTFDLIFASIGVDYEALPTKRAVEFIVYFCKNKLDPMYDNFLNKYLESRNGKNHHVFELEVVGGYGIFIAKKKYIFSKLWEDGNYIGHQGKLKSTGIEIVQTSTSDFVRNSIITFVNMIFAKRGKISPTLFFNMCNALRKKLEDVPIVDIAKIGSLNTYSDYVEEWQERIVLKKKCPAAVRGAARYNHLIYKNGLQNKYAYLKNGMKCKLYYDDKGEPFAFHEDEFPTEIAPPVSIDIQLEKLIFSPVKRLVSGGMIDGDLKHMGTGKNQPSFKDMFKKR